MLRFVALCLLAFTASALAEEFVTMGEYLSRATTHGGKRGVFSGNNEKMVFKDSSGSITWSSDGGWAKEGRASSREIAESRERMRQEKADHDRRVKAGRENPDFGEYISRGTKYHGYQGHWSGSAQDQVFVSSEYGIIYSSRGGWVEGFGPEYETDRSTWGAGISDDANVYADISDPNTIRRTRELKANQLHAVVEANRKFVTVAYRAGDRIVLANTPIPDGTLVPGHMIGKTGSDASHIYRFATDGKGFRFDP